MLFDHFQYGMSWLLTKAFNHVWDPSFLERVFTPVMKAVTEANYRENLFIEGSNCTTW